MKRFSLLLVPALMLAFSSSAFADASFDAFWTKFKTAVVKKDKSAVASMTKFPCLLDSDQLNKAQFFAKYDQIFDKSTVGCFAKAKPMQDKGSYLIFCGEEIYYFSKVNGSWMLTENGVND